MLLRLRIASGVWIFLLLFSFVHFSFCVKSKYDFDLYDDEPSVDAVMERFQIYCSKIHKRTPPGMTIRSAPSRLNIQLCKFISRR
ncbi:unnamed protein product [Caenorhabditis auriculariae]|uniref:Uncharacterized protein n=1 Tax=Caenorhabditis auriculariae TaxID=2777116 RepID=A0A8S1HRY4_9PELO|nr:unnamed protein product [Caenorhabditis auriculariae]